MNDQPKNNPTSIPQQVFEILFHAPGGNPDAIKQMLRVLGEAFGANWICLVEDSPDHQSCLHAYEWCAQGTFSQLKPYCHFLYHSQNGRPYRERLAHQTFYCCPDTTVLSKTEKDALMVLNARSFVETAILHDNVFCGFIRIDTYDSPVSWSQGQLNTIGLIARMLGMFFHQIQRETILSETNRLLAESIQNHRTVSEQFNTIAENVDNSVTLFYIQDGQFTLLYANDRYYQMMGITKKEYQAQPEACVDFAVSPETRAAVHQAISQVIATGKTGYVEYPLRRKDGAVLSIKRRFTIIPQTDHKKYLLISVSTDITEQKEKDIISRELLNALPGGVAILQFTPELKIHYYNEALLKLTGWSLPFPKEKLKEALSLEKCIVPADQGKFKTNVLEKAKEGQSINASFRFYDANHHAMWLHMSAKKLREEKGQAVYYAIFIHPSTEATLYREIIENSDNNIALITADDEQIIFANKCFWSLVGYDRPLTEPISLLDALKLKKICNISELLRDVPDGQFYESPVIASDQGRHYIFRCKRMLWNDIPAVILYIRDETQNEKHLSELRRLLDRLPGGVGIFECDHNRITLSYLNNGYYRLLGDTRENRERFIKHTFFDAVHPDDLPQVLKKAQSMMDGSPHTDLTYRIFGKDKIVWMRIVADMYHDKNGRRIIYCSFSNMDKQMAREIDLKSSKALAEACMKDTKTCAWEFYPKSGRTIMTENAQKLYGLPSILEKMPESLIQDKRIHPDTRDAYRTIFSGQFSEGSPITREIALRSADRKYWRWTRCTAAPIYNDQGDLVKVIGTSMDITDQKNMEDQYHKMLHDLDIANDKNLIAKSRYNLNTTKMEYFQRITEDAIPQSAYRYDDALQATIDTVLGESYRKEMLKTLDRDHLIQAFKAGQNEFNLEYRRKGNDGTVFWASTAVKTFVEPNNGDLMVFIYTRDISEARTAREIIDTVVANDYDYMALLNCKTECYSIYARNDKKTSLPPFHSSSYEKEVEAYARQYVVPEDISKNIHDMSLANLHRQLKSADSFTSYCSLKNKQGEIRRKKLQFICLDRENERVLITRTDITDLYEKEQRQIRQLKSARDAAETANQTKTEFLSRMSHDLRTPMNVVIGLASLALDEVNNPQAMEEALTNITNSGRYLLGLVNDCLDLEKITSGKMELHPKPYYYKDFCNNIRSIIDPLCQGKDVTFVLDTQSDPMPLIVVDRLRMEQIFFNLLSNAVKFTPSGGTVEMLTQNISIHNNQASFDSIVRDNGIGMSQAFQDQMFEPFVQESAPMDVQNQGTGLGLSIVKQLTQLMGATLDVKSKQGTGTTFTIHWTLPLAQPETCPDHVKPQPETQILSGKRVLLAEDHPLNAMIAKKMLEKAGIFVITTQNGQEALDAFKSVVPNYFDAILMDIRMPVMDGLKATRAIRALNRPDAGAIPIIAMTANAFDSDKAETKKAGMNTHLTKPIEPPILYATLARLIQ